MSTELVRQNRSTARQFSETLVDRCRQGVAEQLDQLRDGQLELHENGSRWVCGEVGSLHAELTIDDASAWVDIALGGSIGAAESYMDGHWHSRDLTSLIQLFARNLDALDRIESKQRWWNQATRKLAHWWYDNSRQGAKRNIARHYDLGNDMFKLWLDPLMMYSSAIYPHTNASLEQAAEYKLRRIAEKLKIKATDQVLVLHTQSSMQTVSCSYPYEFIPSNADSPRYQSRLDSVQSGLPRAGCSKLGVQASSSDLLRCSSSSMARILTLG